MKRILFVIMAILCIMIGLYPLIYLFVERTFGLLASKPKVLLLDNLWNITFYGHIFFGGLSLLIGWIQFNTKIRIKRIELHRAIGKVYMLSVLISGICGVYIGYYATGGLVSASGFISLGVIWLYTTIMAYIKVKKGDIYKHQKLMIYSYAACFAAVTLRIWLPLLTIGLGEFNAAYQIVAWLCWVPNILVAFLLTQDKKVLAN